MAENNKAPAKGAQALPFGHDTFEGVPVRFVDFRPLNLKGDGIVPYDSSFRPHQEVLLCFSPGCFHTYVIAGDQEMHPRLFHRIALARPAEPHSIKASMFLRFKGLSDERIRALRDFVIAYQGTRTPSCVFGALELLEQGAGIVLNETTRTRKLYLRPTLRTIFERGFVDAATRAPVAFTTYRINPGTFADYVRVMRKTELKYGWAGELEYPLFLLHRRARSIQAARPARERKLRSANSQSSTLKTDST
jgi:hypothetical protein